MKKCISLFLALLMMFSLCVPVCAASSLSFDLRCEGSEYDSSDGANWLLNVKNGDTITAEFYISAADKTKMSTLQSDIYYDHRVFKLQSYEAVQQGYSGASQYSSVNGMRYVRFGSVTDTYYNTEPTLVGRITLQVIGSRGQSTISFVSCGASTTGAGLGVTKRDLHVSFGGKVLPQYNLYFETSGGSNVQPITVNEGDSATLPGATKTYSVFEGWTLSGDSRVYSAGERVEPESDLYFAAKWAAVPAPAAPGSPKGEPCSDPDTRDGKITGVSNAMEWSTDGENWTACTGSAVTGLSMGTYYVRLKADPAANKPAGEKATVNVGAGERADAPTGLGSLRESLAGTGDGKITGTSTAMEYSMSESFSGGVKSCGSGETTGLSAGVYYVRYKATASRGYSKSATVSVPVGTRPLAPSGLRSVKASLKGVDDGRITGLSTAMEYSTDGEHFTSCTGSELKGLAANTTYYVRYKAISASNTAASSVTVLTIGEGDLRDAPASITGGQTSRPSAADGKLIGTAVTMEYSTDADAAQWIPCTDTETTGLRAGVYFVRLAADGSIPPSNSTAVTVPAGQVPAPGAPTGLTALQESLPGARDGKVRGVSAKMEYSLDGASWTSCSGTEITGLSSGSCFVRLKADAATETPAGRAIEMLIGVGSVPEAPNLACVLPSQPGKADGVVAGTTAAMEWSKNEKTGPWYACTDGGTYGFAAGTYYFRVKANAATNTVAGVCTELVLPEPEFIVDEETGYVESSAIVNGSTATVTAMDQDQLDLALYLGYVELDVSTLGTTVDSAALPRELFSKAANNTKPCSVTVTLSTASINFDAAAVASIVKQTAGQEITVSLQKKDSSALNNAQKAAVKGMNPVMSFEVSLDGGAAITSFGKGTAAIGVPFSVPSGNKPEGYSVWYLASNGKAEKLSTAYRGGMLCFTVPHFSDYVVTYEEPENFFADVPTNHTFYEYISYCYEKGIMKGKSETLFKPGDLVTRAQLVLTLYRMAGSPSTYNGTAMSFTDCGRLNAEFQNAIKWGVAKDLINGYGNAFRPNNSITRQAMVTILYRYAKSVGASLGNLAQLGSYRDHASVSGSMETAVKWAVGNGIISGTADGSLKPQGSTTRGACAKILANYDRNF